MFCRAACGFRVGRVSGKGPNAWIETRGKENKGLYGEWGDEHKETESTTPPSGREKRGGKRMFLRDRENVTLERKG